MTNPNDSIGTNAAYNGRTSVNAFNDDLAAFSRGVISGWSCKPSQGMTVTLGGDGTTRDVAVAADNAGNKTTINNISGLPVSVTISAAPGANSRIDAIIAYVDSSAKGVEDRPDNPGVCGIIPVSGTTASSPSIPNDSAIRSAITSDGANGTSAYYVILATIRVTNGLTTVTQNNITAGTPAKLTGKGVVSSDNVDLSSFATKKVETSNADGLFTFSLYRIGRIVIVSGTRVCNTTLSAGTGLPHRDTVPVGYRPSSAFGGAFIPLLGIDQTDLQGAMEFLPDGTMKYYMNGSKSGAQRFCFNAVYITDDAFPS